MSSPHGRKTIFGLFYEYFPKCPMCKSEKGYDFSGWMNNYAQCRSCWAKWLLDKWWTDKPLMKLVEASRDAERGTVVGHDLFDLWYPIDFWQKLKIKRLRLRETEKEPEILEVKEVREETVPAPKVSMKYVAVGVALLLIIVAGIGIYSQSLRKPSFNVFDLQASSSAVVVYVQNIGSADAHSVFVRVEGWSTYEEYAGFDETEKIETLRVVEIRKAVIQIFLVEGVPATFVSPSVDRFKITVSCAEGVSQVFFFER